MIYDYWRDQHINKGFHPGGIMSKNDFCYVLIPKNSSTFVGQLLLANDWKSDSFLNIKLDNKKFIVLLRDPLDRWITGIAQYLCSHIVPHNLPANVIISQWNTFVETVIFDKIIFDDHTEKQVYFIQGLPLEQCVFFNSSNVPEEKLKKYLTAQGLDLNIDISVDKNSSHSNEQHTKLISFIRKKLTQERVDHIKKTYWEDYGLISKVKFYD